MSEVLSMTGRPVTIAIPVYNGEAFLEDSIESVLAQDFGDFDLILCDNASTDSTWEICNSYVARDKRVSCYRNETNLGAIKNFLLARARSCAPFFKWHAHDDVIDSTFIGKCYRFMAANPDYLACTSRVVFIDEAGRPFLSDYLNFSLDSADPVERFRKFYVQGRNDYAFPYGLMRKAAVDHIGFSKLWGSDWIFVAEMIMQGKIHQIQEPLLFFRIRTKDPESYEVTNGPAALWAARSNFLAFRNIRVDRAVASVIRNSPLLDEQKNRVLSLFRANRPLSQALWLDYIYLLSDFRVRFPHLRPLIRILDYDYMLSRFKIRFPRLHPVLRTLKRRVQRRHSTVTSGDYSQQ